MLDDVQFPRNGWVHRNQFKSKASTKIDWWGLPLIKQDRDTTTIRNLIFDHERSDEFKGKYKNLKISESENTLELFPGLLEIHELSTIEYLEQLINQVSEYLELKTKIISSSSLKIGSNYKGENRIIAICKELSATSYLNSPGGQSLYSPSNFQNEGIELKFLSPYTGEKISILERINVDDKSVLIHELYKDN
jgi:hypothetical protein